MKEINNMAIIVAVACLCAAAFVNNAFSNEGIILSYFQVCFLFILMVSLAGIITVAIMSVKSKAKMIKYINLFSKFLIALIILQCLIGIIYYG